MLHPNTKDLTWQRFGLLLVVGYTAKRWRGSVCWVCRCDCGRLKIVPASQLSGGHCKSCGCNRLAAISNANRKHGQEGRPTYRSWRCMIRRCTNPSHDQYPRYGGRGITVCERWRSFAEFFGDMGERPKGMTIERKNPNGNYEPDNCVWATAKTQSRNRRNTLFVTYEGRTQSLKTWCEELGVKYHLAWERMKRGWSFERATAPANEENEE